MKETITAKLNFKVDEPTANGRVYPASVLRDALRNFGGPKRPLFLHLGVPEDGEVHINRNVGVVKSAGLTEANEVEVSCEMMNPKVTKDLLSGRAELTPVGVGHLGEGNKVEDYHLYCIAAVPVPPPIRGRREHGAVLDDAWGKS